MGFRAVSSVEARFVSARSDSKTGRLSLCSTVGSSVRRRRRGRIADVRGRGFEPPKTWDGFVEMRIRARPWAVVLRAVLASDGKTEYACRRSLTPPCCASGPLSLVFLERENTIDTTRDRDAVDPCWLWVTRIGMNPASKTA